MINNIFKHIIKGIPEHQYKMIEKFDDSNKYILLSKESWTARNDHNFANKHQLLYFSDYFQVWVIILYGGLGRKAKQTYFDVYKSNREPTALELESIPHILTSKIENKSD